jgi:peptide/nickel transport system permease protein
LIPGSPAIKRLKNAIGHLLPVLLLGYYSLASITRLTRSACLSEMNKEYILLARAKGAGEMTILLRHVLPIFAALC